MNDITKQRRYSKKEILAILRLQEKSPASVTEFCKAHKIHKATFYNWRNRLAIENEKQGEFVSLHLPDQAFQEKLFAEIELSSNIRVKLFQQVEASYFKALII